MRLGSDKIFFNLHSLLVIFIFSSLSQHFILVIKLRCYIEIELFEFWRDVEIIPKAKRSKFLVTEESDEDLGEDGLDDSEEEEDDLFDSVCAICDNGGELLW